MCNIVEKIQFSESHPQLDYYESVYWHTDESKLVEFFPGNFFSVTLVSVESSDFEHRLMELDDGNPLALDLEWETELCLFQICSSKGVLIIRHPEGPGNKVLKDFLQSHKFYGKGTENDTKMLFRKFGNAFADNIEDIAKTRLHPYGHSVNFIEMVSQFAETLPTVQFKDSKITKSDWSQQELTMRQVLYAAYDVVALFVCYPNYPPPMATPKQKHTKEKKKSDRVQRELAWSPAPLRPTFSYILRNYKEPTHPIALRSRFPEDHIDYVHAWKDTIFVSLYNPLEKGRFECDIEEIPSADLSLSSDCDVFYLTDVPDEIQSRVNFGVFMYSFGFEHSFDVFANFIRVSCKSAAEAHRFRTFIPHLEIGGKRITVSPFPFFLCAIYLVNLPRDITHKQIYALVSPYGTVKSMSLKEYAKITYESDVSVEAAIEGLDGRVFRGMEIRATRKCDTKHVKHLRKYQLFCTDCTENAQLKQRFAPFGKLFSASYIKELDISVVRFMTKADAIRAASPTAFLGRPDAILIIRSVSCATIDAKVIEILSRFGRVLSIYSQQRSKATRTVEVLFESPESARNAQLYVQNFVLDGFTWFTSCPYTSEHVPQWRTELRNHWIALRRELKSESDIIKLVSQYGTVVDATMNDRHVFVMFAYADQAASAYEALRESHKASYLTLQQFVSNTNARDLHLSVRAVSPAPQSDAVTLDPVPEGLTKDAAASLCGENSIVCVADSLKHAGQQRMVIFSQTTSESSRVFALLSHASITRNWSVLPTTERVTDIEKPDFPMKLRNRVLIVISPLPEGFNEAEFCNMVREFGSFNVCVSAATIVVQSKKARSIKELAKHLKQKTDYNVSTSFKYPQT